MGYTHYFTQHGEISEEDWRKITEVFNQIMERSNVSLSGENDEASPIVDDMLIWFNGVGSESHEPMRVSRTGSGFHFCKTARKSYDVVVTALLCVLNFYTKSYWDIRSDGDESEWEEGRRLAEEVIGETVDIPDGVTQVYSVD